MPKPPNIVISKLRAKNSPCSLQVYTSTQKKIPASEAQACSALSMALDNETESTQSNLDTRSLP